jgi:hypothetical protein
VANCFVHSVPRLDSEFGSLTRSGDVFDTEMIVRMAAKGQSIARPGPGLKKRGYRYFPDGEAAAEAIVVTLSFLYSLLA